MSDAEDFSDDVKVQAFSELLDSPEVGGILADRDLAYIFDINKLSVRVEQGKQSKKTCGV
jgi:hypothetical protein